MFIMAYIILKLQFDINLWHLLCFKVSFQIQF